MYMRSAKSYFILLYATCQYFFAFYYIIIFQGGEKMRPLKEKISITIDKDVLEKTRAEAEKDDRSLSQYINLILREHLQKTEGNK